MFIAIGFRRRIIVLIVQYILETYPDADLILIGRRHKTAWSAALAGSVSDMVSHASPVDVMVVR